jgi:dolichol kinase
MKIIMDYYIISLPVSLLFIFIGITLFYYAIKLKMKYPKEHNFVNSNLTFFLWLTAGVLYPFLFLTDNSKIRVFQVLSTFSICIFTPVIIFFILYYQYHFVVKKNPNIKKKRNINTFLTQLESNQAKSSKVRILKINYHRKALHLFPAALIIFLWIFALYIWADTLKADEVWGISGEEFGRFLILTAGYSGILIFAALDIIRLSFIFDKRNLYHLIPDKVLNLLGKTMKREESFQFTKPAIITLSFAPIFFYPFGIFASAALIATIGDGAACIFGLKYGKIKFPKSSNKTIVGYIAGFLASFLVSLIMLYLFDPHLRLFKLLFISLSGALTFFIIDISNVKIDDNILNPLLSAFLMGTFYYLL